MSAPDAFVTFDKNTAGYNVGNYLFSDAAHKLLTTSSSEVEMGGHTFSPKSAGRINSSYDAFILPLANLFHGSRLPALRALTEFIEALRIPVLLTSVGAQSKSTDSIESLLPIGDDVKRFCRAVLERSTAIPVRGEFTARYLQHLGFSEVDVVGCPSLTLAGRDLQVRDLSDGIGKPVAYNTSVNTNVVPHVVDEVDRLPGSVYFPQDYGTLELMLWGHSRLRDTLDSRLPVHINHVQFAHDRAEFMLDSYSWISRMEDFAFTFGPRIHGNVVSLLAGTPAVVLAHDSRTLELSEYHCIPHFSPDELQNLGSLREIAERADFKEFNRSHGARFDRYLSYLEKSGFKHIYESDEIDTLRSYETEASRVVRQPPAKTAWSGHSDLYRSRLARDRVREIGYSKWKAKIAAQ